MGHDRAQRLPPPGTGARLLALCDAPEWIRAQSLVRIGRAFASVDADGAVLLVGAPLPDAEDSRYRARIYRGMSMTV